MVGQFTERRHTTIGCLFSLPFSSTSPNKYLSFAASSSVLQAASPLQPLQQPESDLSRQCRLSTALRLRHTERIIHHPPRLAGNRQAAPAFSHQLRPRHSLFCFSLIYPLKMESNYFNGIRNGKRN